MPFWDRDNKPTEREPGDPPIASPSGAVVLRGNAISIDAPDIKTAKVAIKECQAFKKEMALQKREINSVMADIRADRRLSLGTQGSMVRGGGSFGTIMRSMQRASRDSARASHAQRLAPYENLKLEIDEKIRGFDKAILELQHLIVRYEQEGMVDETVSGPRPQNCSYCGAERERSSRFCSQCGAAF